MPSFMMLIFYEVVSLRSVSLILENPRITYKFLFRKFVEYKLELIVKLKETALRR